MTEYFKIIYFILLKYRTINISIITNKKTIFEAKLFE